MLDDAVAAFLEAVSERGFDEPLMAILRSAGFDRVRLVHGSAEFGKDIIAQRDGEQWAFQSKAGSIGQDDWRQGAGQLDELRLSRLSHPDFNLGLVRRPVLALTGRLVGNAPLSAQEYNQRAREHSEPELEIWDRDVLLGMLSGNPDSVLRGSVDGQLLTLLGAIDQRRIDMDAVEVFSRRWTSWEPERLSGLGIVETTVACERLKAAERLDLACQLALCAVRGARVAALDARNVGTDAAGALFATYAGLLWDECDDRLLREKGLIAFSGPSAWVTYPLRCLRLAELISLLALHATSTEPDLADEIAAWVNEFVNAQPGAARVIGDRYAVSLVPVTLVLARYNIDAATNFLRAAAIWLCDRYERGELGVAGVDAGPSEETARVLGGAFDSVSEERRIGSQAAAVILDLAALFQLHELYSDIRNDTLAVGLRPDILLTEDGPDRFVRTGLTNRWQFNVDYAEALDGDSLAAPHLLNVDAAAALLDNESAWDLLAVSAVLRDRHFPNAIHSYIDGHGSRSTA